MRVRNIRPIRCCFAPRAKSRRPGAANFMLIRDGELMTRSLDSTFLHGVTRDSLLTMGRDMGYTVTEKKFDVLEMLDWVAQRRSGSVRHRRRARGCGHADLRGIEHRVGHRTCRRGHQGTARQAGRSTAGVKHRTCTAGWIAV